MQKLVRRTCATGVKARAVGGPARRYLTLLSPPKFENEKIVSRSEGAENIPQAETYNPHS